MNQTNDPFVHHPELRDKISDPLQSFFRTFRIENMVDIFIERGLPTGWWHSDEKREASRTQALQHLGNEDLWIFGYGSLMWDPAFIFQEVRKCHAPGFARKFILKEQNGGRGSPDKPGLVAALDIGDGCDGLAFRIANHQVETETEILWRREMITSGYTPAFVDVKLDDQTVSALTFIADHDAEMIDASLTHDQQVEMIATASGILGTSLEYLQNIADNMEALRIEDSHVSELLRDSLAYAHAHQANGD